MATAKKTTATTTRQLAVTDITADAAHQFRYDVPPIDDYVAILQEAEGKEWPFPPLLVAECGKELILYGGFTRLRAAKHVGREKVPCEVTKMSKALIFQAALAENATHGYRRTKADIRKTVLAAQGRYPGWSLRRLAEVCGVSSSTVRRVREEIGGDELPEEAAVTSDDLGVCQECQVSAWVETAKGTQCGICRLPWGEDPQPAEESEPPPVSETEPKVTGEELKDAKDGPKAARLRREAITSLHADVGRVVRQVDALGCLSGDLRACLARLKHLLKSIN